MHASSTLPPSPSLNHGAAGAQVVANDLGYIGEQCADEFRKL